MNFAEKSSRMLSRDTIDFIDALIFIDILEYNFKQIN